MRTKDILKKVVEKNKISDDEYKKVMKTVRQVIEKLESMAEHDIEVKLGGSAAKGTMIKDDFDCDVFVMFPDKYEDSRLSDYLEYELKKHWYIRRLHGSRDYFQVVIENIVFEFVPVRKIENAADAVNVTDSSPLHVDWILEKIRKNPELKDEIMLTKLFCKANKVYGAESYIRGFSGHVIDIITTYYKGFINLLEGSASWRANHVIDIEGHGTAKKLNKSKISPLIVIDPIQPERNAAASLSMEMFERFRDTAKRFLACPSEGFFIRHKTTQEDLELAAKDSALFMFRVMPLDTKPDVAGSKMVKVLSHMLTHMKINGFEIIDSGWEWDKGDEGMLWIMVKDVVLPEKTLREGPPEKAKENFESFMKKHPEAFIKNNRAYAYVDTPFRTPEDLVRHLLHEKYITEKVRSIDLIGKHG